MAIHGPLLPGFLGTLAVIPPGTHGWNVDPKKKNDYFGV
jgi:hypothetical protein